mmetsp:Transcript_9279/g.11330  ORF Transcript_9279/g.11330 Transcript_9279/m.11330 type:complete len:87 (-) Transcript_9279:1737-1997(-)
MLLDHSDGDDNDGSYNVNKFMGSTPPGFKPDFFKQNNYSQRMFHLNLSTRIGTIRVKDFFENTRRSSIATHPTSRGTARQSAESSP